MQSEGCGRGDDEFVEDWDDFVTCDSSDDGNTIYVVGFALLRTTRNEFMWWASRSCLGFGGLDGNRHQQKSGMKMEASLLNVKSDRETLLARPGRPLSAQVSSAP